VTGGAIIVARALEAVQLETTSTSRAGLASRTERVGRALLGALACLRVARIRSARRIDVHRAGTLAIARLGVYDPVPITGTVLTDDATFVFAAHACAIAGSVLAAGGGRFGDAEIGIGRLCARRDEGADAEGAWQVARLATVGASRIATDSTHTIAASAFIVARARFGLALGATASIRASDPHGRIRLGIVAVPTLSIDSDGGIRAHFGRKVRLRTAGRNHQTGKNPGNQVHGGENAATGKTPS
jgi:hypothetical protein